MPPREGCGVPVPTTSSVVPVKPFIVFTAIGFVAVGAWTGSWPVGLLAGLGLWLLTVQFWPWTGCGTCNNSGKHRDFTGQNWRDCGTCGGRGKQLRTFVMRKDLA